MTAISYSPAHRRPEANMLRALLILALVIGGVVVVAGKHADVSHAGDGVKPASIRATFEAQGATEKYYSPSKARALFLTPLPGLDLWGGMFLTNPLDAPVYEVTVFAAPYARWQSIIRRDGYQRIP